ncbi:PIN domain-containing protein [Thermococcus thioreducens]|uniref:Predicted nucleic acid-binding protein, contains PIN domain n=1 Tax=Thermococcus thioreducens TaxID=277988 RepID=A0A0Q2XM31_9EURY|nr:PIN domain-containing protein [Thermococcus thioreducens]ASJ12790.1 hypothetical protein A3L14_07780 [Thermococcus thioreducens]KQH82260.1 hypothetical protein AMR53_06535 [Thermococcus thioreducens]SEV85196.1 Predicted nucleic acid-binding protein, contains PIN domain [Thermococcus thioreducens]
MVLKLVVDTNVLFSIFKKESQTRKLIYLSAYELELHSPLFAIGELKNYRDVIIRKAKISDVQFYEILYEMGERIRLWPIKDYAEFISLAERITPDPDDVPFVALSLKLNAPLWSNDKRLKKITQIHVVNTSELIKLLEELR